MTTPCPYCPKSFKNLNSHIEKTHTNYECRISNDKISLFEIKNGVERFIRDGTLETEGDDMEEYYFLVDFNTGFFAYVDKATGLVNKMDYEYYAYRKKTRSTKPIAARRFKTIKTPE